MQTQFSAFFLFLFSIFHSFFSSSFRLLNRLSFSFLLLNIILNFSFYLILLPPVFVCIFSLQYLLPYLHIVLLSRHINIIFSFSGHLLYLLSLSQPTLVIFPRTHTQKGSIQLLPLSFIPSNVPSPFINPIYVSLYPSDRYPLTCSLFSSFPLSFPLIAHTWVYSSVMWMRTRVSAWQYNDYHADNPGCVTNRHIVAQDANDVSIVSIAVRLQLHTQIFDQKI